MQEMSTREVAAREVALPFAWKTRMYTADEREVRTAGPDGREAVPLLPEGLRHRRLCSPRCCTAYTDANGAVQHRSEPRVFLHCVDQRQLLYVLAEARDDGADQFLHLVKVEPSYRFDWWEPEPTLFDVLLPLPNATPVHQAVGDLAGLVMPEAPAAAGNGHQVSTVDRKSGCRRPRRDGRP